MEYFINIHIVAVQKKGSEELLLTISLKSG